MLFEIDENWTDEEKENIKHFFGSFDTDMGAIRISNRGPAFSTLSPNEVAEILRLEKKALAEAEALRDEVLAKAHPDLPRHYRDEFQKSLELRIRNFEAEAGDLPAEVEASVLHDRWVGWYSRHRKQIKIPK